MNVHQASVVVLTASPSTILDITLDGEAEAAIYVKNNSVGNAWTLFEVHVQTHKSGPLVRIANIAADFSSPLWPLRRADPLVTLAASTIGKLWLNAQGIYRLVLKAQVAVANSTADVDAQIV